MQRFSRKIRTTEPTKLNDLKALKKAAKKWVHKRIMHYHRLGLWAVTELGYIMAGGGDVDHAFLEDAVGVVLDVLRINRTTLDQAMASYQWLSSHHDLKVLLSQPGKNGIGLCWGHIKRLAGLRRKPRQILVNLVLERGLSIRQLKSEIDHYNSLVNEDERRAWAVQYKDLPLHWEQQCDDLEVWITHVD